MAHVTPPPFNGYRTGFTAALNLFAPGLEWRQQWLDLQSSHLARDEALLAGALEAAGSANDWSDWMLANQSVLRDYVSASTALWQQTATAAIHGAGAWSDSARDVLQQWQDVWTNAQPGANSGAALPMRAWMAAFEHRVADVTDSDPMTNGTAGTTHRGGQHAG